MCFDVDSTVCSDEGIDELAAFLGCGEAVAALTASAMGGSLPFQDALAGRLALMRPSAAALDAFLLSRPPPLTPGVADLVATLHARGTSVCLVSGGFTQMIYPVADALRIPRSRVYANTILFGDDGSYAGFDRSALTSRSGGKAAAVAAIRSGAPGGASPLVMVGDGATDAEARAPGGADAFVCFTGVISRPSVVAVADWVVGSFDELMQPLQQTNDK